MNNLSNEKLEFLKEKARQIRIEIIKSITEANSGHPGGSLSAADILSLIHISEPTRLL